MKISEAMSEIKLFVRKIHTQQEFILKHLKRESWRVDPFEKDNTTQEAQVAAAIQSISDLEKNIVNYRTAINKKNMELTVSIEGISMSVAEWLAWKREVFPLREEMLQNIARSLPNMQDLLRMRMSDPNTQPTNYTVNISDKWLHEEIQKLEAIEQRLDGMLSLINASEDIDL